MGKTFGLFWWNQIGKSGPQTATNSTGPCFQSGTLLSQNCALARFQLTKSKVLPSRIAPMGGTKLHYYSTQPAAYNTRPYRASVQHGVSAYSPASAGNHCAYQQQDNWAS